MNKQTNDRQMNEQLEIPNKHAVFKGNTGIHISHNDIEQEFAEKNVQFLNSDDCYTYVITYLKWRVFLSTFSEDIDCYSLKWIQ